MKAGLHGTHSWVEGVHSVVQISEEKEVVKLIREVDDVRQRAGAQVLHFANDVSEVLVASAKSSRNKT